MVSGNEARNGSVLDADGRLTGTGQIWRRSEFYVRNVRRQPSALQRISRRVQLTHAHYEGVVCTLQCHYILSYTNSSLMPSFTLYRNTKKIYIT